MTTAVLRGGALDGYAQLVPTGVAGLPPPTIGVDDPVVNEALDQLAGWARIVYFRVTTVSLGLPDSWEYRILSARAL